MGVKVEKMRIDLSIHNQRLINKLSNALKGQQAVSLVQRPM